MCPRSNVTINKNPKHLWFPCNSYITIKKTTLSQVIFFHFFGPDGRWWVHTPSKTPDCGLPRKLVLWQSCDEHCVWTVCGLVGILVCTAGHSHFSKVLLITILTQLKNEVFSFLTQILGPFSSLKKGIFPPLTRQKWTYWT